MAPIFYCLCDRCNCTATVLITQYIRNTKKIINDDQDFGVTSRVEDLHTQAIPSVGDLEESKTRSNCPTTDKHVGVDEDSVIILLCLLVLAIGEHYLLTQKYSVYIDIQSWSVSLCPSGTPSPRAGLPGGRRGGWWEGCR